ncbi:MAG: hypothetical protein KGL39_25135 [Patescibacteria group bacterium]|nr:hypothetical protein [Patescibacteria group bacterium]
MKINIPNKLPDKQIKAFTEITEKLFENPEIDTLFLSGSFYYGDNDSNSDLDFLAITQSEFDYFQRIQDASNGVFYELFIYSEKQLKRSFELMDYQDMHMVGYGFLVFSKSNNFENIRKLAKDLFEKGPQKISGKELEYEEYLLWDKYTDILDILEKDDSLANSLMNLLLWDSLRLLYIKKCVWFPKKKRLLESLVHVDSEIYSLTCEFLNPISSDSKKLLKTLDIIIEKIIYPKKLSEPFIWQSERKNL